MKFQKHHRQIVFALLAGAGSLSAMPHPTDGQMTPSTASASRCQALNGLTGFLPGVPDARITKATFKTAEAVNPSGDGMGGADRVMPPHCEIEGAMRDRTGSDGKHYVVNFRLRMPSDWNGRFLYQGGGGTNGFVGNAVGPVFNEREPTALERGFAVVAADGGHDNEKNFDKDRAGIAAFGYDYLAREELADKSLDSVATAAKTLIARFYARRPDRSYFFGCSNGGREGMIFAERFPTQFDGIYAAAPAKSVPRAAIAMGLQMQRLAGISRRAGFVDATGLPDLSKSFSPADLKLASEAIRSVCDARDGIEDGLIQDFAGCTTARVRPALAQRQCTGGKNASCLSADQISTLVTAASGVKLRSGKPVYAPFPWDIGLTASDWLSWTIGDGRQSSIGSVLVMPGVAAAFMTPADTIPGTPDAAMRYMLSLDAERAIAGIMRTAPGFPRSGWALFNANSTDLDTFRRRGGKLLIPHGAADGVFSIHDTVDWWRNVDRRYGNAASFVRVFNVPGAAHCFPGDSVDQFDGLTSLVNWVEKKEAPDRITAWAGAQTPWKGGSRPLCPYPEIARYKSGDPEDHHSFNCENPRKGA